MSIKWGGRGCGHISRWSESVANWNGSPSLYLDFVDGTQTLDPRITFTRATTATFTGSDGLIQTAAINAPRFDYNPTTLAPKGLLIEEQRTNLLTYSEQFDNAAWTKSNSTITANTVVSPDGTVNADTLTGSAGTSIKRVRQSAANAGTSWAYSVYLKAGSEPTVLVYAQNQDGTAYARAQVTFATGSIVKQAGVGVTSDSASLTDVGNGWYRATLVWTFSVAPTSVFGEVWLAGFSTTASTGTFFVYGAQLEAGAFPTSYIPTVASQVTRSADVAVMTGTNFSSWYNASEGTLFVGALTPPNLAAFPTVAAISDGSANNQITHYVHTSGYYSSIRSGGVVQGDPGRIASPVTGTPYKFAAGLIVNNAIAAANGLTGGADTLLLMPVGVNQMRIGANATGISSNTHIRQIAYYPRRLANSELQAITA